VTTATAARPHVCGRTAVGLRLVVRALVAPVVWLLAVLLFVAQQAGEAFADLLHAYNRGAVALGRALLRFGKRLVDWLGPLGRLLRALAAPVWHRVKAVWRWLNVQILMRMFRPLRRFGRWVARHALPLLTRLVGLLRQLLAHLEPALVRLTQGLETVERAAARLAAGWRRLWAPVLRTVVQWRRGPAAERSRRAGSTG